MGGVSVFLRFRVRQGSDVVKLSMSAAAGALDDGRTETTDEDVLIALTRDRRTAPVLAERDRRELTLTGDDGRGGPVAPQGAVSSQSAGDLSGFRIQRRAGSHGQRRLLGDSFGFPGCDFAGGAA